jgi:hypothetical protein
MLLQLYQLLCCYSSELTDNMLFIHLSSLHIHCS